MRKDPVKPIGVFQEKHNFQDACETLLVGDKSTLDTNQDSHESKAGSSHGYSLP
jgi:hypothetical protein